MRISKRSVLMAGVATLTVTAIAAAPSVQPGPPPRTEPAAAVQLTAQAQPLLDRAELTAWVAAAQRRAPNSIVSDSPVADQQAAPTALVAFPGLGNAIIGIYNLVIPVVDYGVELAQYFVGWIPFGWIISDQIGIFYFDLIRPIVTTITFNVADWIGGSVSFLQGLNNVILDSANAGIGFLNAEINWGWGLLPPLPFPPPQIPLLPWFGLLQTQTAGVTAEDLTTPEVGVTNAASDLVDAIYVPVRNGIDYGVDVLQAALAPIPLVNIAGDQVSILWNSLVQPVSNSVVFDLIDPVLNQPLNINSYINGAYDVGVTTVDALIDTGINEINYFAGFPLIPTAAAQARELDRTAEVSTVPSIVKSSPVESRVEAPAGPLSQVTNTVRNEIRAGLTERRTDEPNKISEAAQTGGNGDADLALGSDHATRGAVTKAVSDVTTALRPGKPSKSVDGATNTPTDVVKSFGDTARKVVKQVREAAKDARDAVKNQPASDADE